MTINNVKTIKILKKIMVKKSIIQKKVPFQKNILRTNMIMLIIFGIIATTISFLLDKIVLYFVIDNQYYVLEEFFRIITLIGETIPFIFITILIIVIFYYYKKPFTQIIYSTITSTIIGTILKYLTLRPRPYEFLHIQSIISTTYSSFPSGHARAVFTILPILNNYFPKYKIYLWSIAILVAISRIYLSVHWLSDVVAGAFIGYIIGYFFVEVSKKI